MLNRIETDPGSQQGETIELYIPQSMERELIEARTAISEIFNSAGELIFQVLPAIHRVQKVYGPMRYTSPKTLADAVKVDLNEYEGLDNSESIANTALESLSKIEGYLLPIGRKKAMLVSSDLGEQISERYEAACEVADEFVAKSLWEQWDPTEPSEYNVTDSILLKVLGNLKYLEIKTKSKGSKNQTNPFDQDNDTLNDDRKKSHTDLLIRQKQKRIAPSPEEMIIIKELWEEYISMFDFTSQPLLLEYHFSGYTNAEIAQLLHIGEKTIPSALFRAKQEAITLAISRYKWEPEDAALFNFNREGNAYTSPTLESDLDFTSVFKDKDLNEVFAMIDSLPSLMKKCVLFRIGYIGDKLTAEQWGANEKISMHTYKSRLQKAYDFLIKLDHAHTSLNIWDIVQSVTDHKMLVSTNGRLIAERSNVRDVAEDQREFPDGFFNEEEMRLRQSLINERKTSGKILEIKDIRRAFGWTEAKIVAMLPKISKTDPEEMRFSTKEHLIQSDTARWQLISWYIKNKDSNQMFQLSRLNPEQLFLFGLLTSIENHYYLSDEEIKIRYEQQFNLPSPEKRSFSPTAKLALDALTQEPSYALLQVYFEKGLKGGSFLGKQQIAANIALERLNRHESLVFRAVEESIKEADVSRTLWLNLMQDARRACSNT